MEHNGSKAATAIIIYGVLRFSTDLLSNLQSQTWSSVSADITKVKKSNYYKKTLGGHIFHSLSLPPPHLCGRVLFSQFLCLCFK